MADLKAVIALTELPDIEDPGYEVQPGSLAAQGPVNRQTTILPSVQQARHGREPVTPMAMPGWLIGKPFLQGLLLRQWGRVEQANPSQS